tara:strand:+ start:1184 stop:2185 length:1002 start_codon:yes stop_codon:yes gene_type:complete
LGVKLRDLVVQKPITLPELAGKTLMVDAYNTLYQFITTIRSMDGGLFTDEEGNVTSHLMGLFSRCTNFAKHKLHPVFVFDGKVPKLKQSELDRRKDIKAEAGSLYEEAKAKGDVADMKKYAARTSRLTPSMVKDAKTLLGAMGIPVVQAPAEGEAQAAHMVAKGDGWAVVSQDFDSLLHRAPRLVINLNIAGRKRRGLSSVPVEPAIINLKQTLQKLELSQKQLIMLAMLVGTDYSKGVKGIGPKKALALIQKHKTEKVFAEAGWDDHNDTPWQQVYETFTTMPTTDEYDLQGKAYNKDQVYSFLMDRGFSPDRVKKTLESLPDTQQKRLGDW